MRDVGSRLLAAGIFLALEIPLGFIAYRATRRARPLLTPVALLLLAVILPDEAWGGLLLFVSLMLMFAVAIRARVQKTRREEERQLAQSGPSPWLGQSRRSSLALIGVGAAMAVIGTLADASPHSRSVAGMFIFAGGSIMLGMGLFRRHTVLVFYLGRRRARWLEVIQVSTAFAAYGLAASGEFATDSDLRLTLRLLSFVPFALHFLVVWVPLAKAQERPALPETPFA
jgi:hypothetical protein